MENLSAGDLNIDVSAPADGPLLLTWRGKSNDRQPSRTLRPFFETVQATASQRGGGVEMHFEQLEHFNSSTITALIQLIQALRSSDIKLVIVFSAELKWQKLSFEALRIFEKPDGLLTFRAV